MEQNTEYLRMLDLLTVPAFSAIGGVIEYVNQGAKALFLAEGDKVEPLLKTGQEALETLTEGSLFLTLNLGGGERSASVHIRDGRKIFVAEEGEDESLNLLALAAQKLREPLSDVMSVTDQMFPELMETEDSDRLRQMAQINRGLYRILRAVGNMSDAGQYLSGKALAHFEPTELGSFYYEIFQQVEGLAQAAGVKMTYRCPRTAVNGMADRQKLERAVYNLLSNALKFTPRGGEITMELERTGALATLKITDTGEGIPGDMLSTVFARYRREPSFGDSRWGIGLGLPMVARAAALHGGTLLLRKAEGGGAAVALAIRLNERDRLAVSAPVFRVDYAGEHDHSFVELADCLPWSVFEAGSIN